MDPLTTPSPLQGSEENRPRPMHGTARFSQHLGLAILAGAALFGGHSRFATKNSDALGVLNNDVRAVGASRNEVALDGFDQAFESYLRAQALLYRTTSTPMMKTLRGKAERLADWTMGQGHRSVPGIIGQVGLTAIELPLLHCDWPAEEVIASQEALLKLDPKLVLHRFAQLASDPQSSNEEIALAHLRSLKFLHAYWKHVDNLFRDTANAWLSNTNAAVRQQALKIIRSLNVAVTNEE